MGWDYEVIGEREVKDLSYKRIYATLISNKEKMGLSAAVKKSINDFQIVDIDSKKEPDRKSTRLNSSHM